MNSKIKFMLSKYNCKNSMDYQRALKEIIQEITLDGLSKGGFFDKAAFTGGTALRIFHGIDRFSEDLDFSLMEPDPDFRLDLYFDVLKDVLYASGFEMEISQKSKKREKESAVKAAFLKENTLKLLVHFTPLSPPVPGVSRSDIVKIKLEVDTNPPAGAKYEEKMKSYPEPYFVRLFELPSMYATKLHALICRPYPKGRDYYDLIFFCQHEVGVNLPLLRNALIQTGDLSPEESFTIQDVREKLHNRIDEVDISVIKKDVGMFVETSYTFQDWSRDTFHYFVNEINQQNFV